MNLIPDLLSDIKNIHLWLDIFYLIIAYGISIYIGHLIVFPISDDAYFITLKEKYEQWEIGPHRWTSICVGILERIIITTSLIFGVTGVLAIWYGIKIISKVNVWNEEKKDDARNETVKHGRGRALFNIYLIGTALSLIYGAFGAQVFYWLHYHYYLHFLLSAPVLIGAGFICRKKINQYRKEVIRNLTISKLLPRQKPPELFEITIGNFTILKIQKH